MSLFSFLTAEPFRFSECFPKANQNWTHVQLVWSILSFETGMDDGRRRGKKLEVL
jgi:hypothetical protein